MGMISSQFGNLPGMTQIIETYDAATQWGPQWQLVWWNGYIASTAADPGNSPTWRLRPGLVLGVITASGQWTNYSATATDGSQVARGVLAYGMRMQDVLTGVNTTKYYAILVGGRVQGTNLLGLDQNARDQMALRFIFDDGITGANGTNTPFPQSKTANYTALLSDNNSIFDNTGAIGAVAITLPAIQNGLIYGIRVIANQNMSIVSAEGTNIVALNNAGASSLAFSTGSQLIGGGVTLYSNAAGTLWIAQNTSAGSNAITVA
jgi:hypothetical protein